MTRGERNCNPGNIRVGCPWVGIDTRKKDSEFCVFVSMKYGVRALIVTLRTYVCKHRLHTIEQIIRRWAPPQDRNNTTEYIRFVKLNMLKYREAAKTLGKEVHGNDDLSLYTADFDKDHIQVQSNLYYLAKAMCMLESRYTLTETMYRDAWEVV